MAVHQAESVRVERPASRVATSWGRPVAAFAVVLVGMLGVSSALVTSSACWAAWLAVGIVAGLIAGSMRQLWVVAAALAPFFALAIGLGHHQRAIDPNYPLYWAVLMLVGATVVAAGSGIGVVVVEHRRGIRPGHRRLAGGLVALGFVGLVGWTAFSGWFGSETMLHPATDTRWDGCRTPAFPNDWAYEAINYDIADDDRLRATDPDMVHCAPQPSTTGTAVVSADGTPIAGWYIPAASGIGPHGPTIVIAPGWKSNKSEILKYAPPFRDRFNLVLFDLRNGGRSGGDTTTFGYRERQDARAIIDWLVATKHPSWIGAMGNSMGAVTLLAEAADDDRVRALILDSMHASVVTAWGDGIEAEGKLPGYPTAWATVALASARIGGDLTTVDPERTIAAMGDRPVLLIHSEDDILDVLAHSAERVFAAGQAAGVPIELRSCPGARHGEVIDTCGPAWTSWVDDFLTRAAP